MGFSGKKKKPFCSVITAEAVRDAARLLIRHHFFLPVTFQSRVGPRLFYFFSSLSSSLSSEPAIKMCRVMLWQRRVLLLLIRGLLEIPQGESSQCFHCHDWRKWTDDGAERPAATARTRTFLQKNNVILT